MNSALLAASGGGSFSTTLAIIAGVGITAQWVAWRLQVPSIILLLAAGLVIGPVAGVVNPDVLMGDSLFGFVAISVALIMFEGGLDLPPRELRAAGSVVWRLVTLGAGVTLMLSTIASEHLFGLDRRAALVIGAVLTVTGPTVIGPLLSFVRPSGSVGPTLRTEGIIIDPIGATAALIAYEIALISSNADPTATITNIIMMTLAVGLGLGIVGAFVLDLALRKFLVPDNLANPVGLAMVIVGFVTANSVQEESGLITVTVMGMWLARNETASVRRLHEFNESLRTILISVLFILLAARVDPEALWSVLLPTLGLVAFLVLVVRPASVLVATLGSRMPLAERVLLACVCPRGIVAAAVSASFGLRLEQAGVEGAEKIAPAIFLVIIGTIVFYGFAAGPVAKRLGLADTHADGVLIVGGGAVARGMALQIMAQGPRVIIVDSDEYNTRRCRRLGIEAITASVFTDEIIHDLDLRGIGQMVALTSSDETNALATSRFERAFGRSNTFQLEPSESSALPEEMIGRIVGAEAPTFGELDEKARMGWRIKSVDAEEAAELVMLGLLVPLARKNQELSFVVKGSSVPTTGVVIGQVSPEVSVDIDARATSSVNPA